MSMLGTLVLTLLLPSTCLTLPTIQYVHDMADLFKKEQSVPPPSGWLCISGDTYGRTGNQLLTVGYALWSARKRRLEGVQVVQACGDTAHAGDCSSVQPWKNEIEMPADLLFGDAMPCTQTQTWEALYFEQNAVRGDGSITLPIPSLAVRMEAEFAWPLNGTRVSVHGRSLEGGCPIMDPICPSRRLQVEHTLCDYSWPNVVALNFNIPPGTVPRLFTDRQNSEMDSTYTVIDDHAFMVQLWMMVLSDIHIGNTQSSIDYMVWLWRQHMGLHYGAMHPADCYTGPDQLR